MFEKNILTAVRLMKELKNYLQIKEALREHNLILQENNLRYKPFSTEEGLLELAVLFCNISERNSQDDKHLLPLRRSLRKVGIDMVKKIIKNNKGDHHE